MLAICSLTKNRLERKALASRILHTSFEMFPCSNCEKNNTKCVVLDKENSSRCSECVLCKVKCNVKGVLVSKWRFLELETSCLASKKEVAFAVLKSAQRTALESTAHIEQLEKQERFLKSKGKDMVCCSLKTIDKLDKAEEKERQKESKQAAVAAMPSSSLTLYALALGVETNPFAGLEVLLLPLRVWAN
jgi:hypothetical protein